MLGALTSLLLLLAVLIDAFEAMILPRRVIHRFRLARWFYWTTWRVWRLAASGFPAGKRRESFLSLYGPLSLLGLFAVWVAGLIFAFGLLHWSLGTTLQPVEGPGDLPIYLYFSGTTLTTLGYGDVVAVRPLGRLLSVLEAALGLGFLACVMGYLPVLYQAFSRREVTISLLDARAGSPPSAAEFLSRAAQARSMPAVMPFLAEWERWAGELLESHLSYPVLSFYRSQHDNQSWIAALATIMDTSAVLMTQVAAIDAYQAQLTFAMARHAAVDLAMTFGTIASKPAADRLPAERLQLLRERLRSAGLKLRDEAAAETKLTELRAMYEPFVYALADYFRLTIPAIVPDTAAVDNWQTSAWMRRVPGLSHLPLPDERDDHF
jgi:hypothetical protein